MNYSKIIVILVLSTTVAIAAKSKRPMLKCPKKDNKIIICHIPPGNPDNAKVLAVGKDSVQDHLDHGDHLNYCSHITYEEKKELCGICDSDVDPTCN